MKASAAWTKEDRQDTRVTEDGGVSPEAGAGDAHRAADFGHRAGERARQLVVGRDFVCRPAEDGRADPRNVASSRASVARISCTSASASRLRLARQRSPLHLQHGAVGIAAQLVAALDERGRAAIRCP